MVAMEVGLGYIKEDLQRAISVKWMLGIAVKININLDFCKSRKFVLHILYCNYYGEWKTPKIAIYYYW